MQRPTITLKEWFQQEPFGLTLSAGFFGFYAHAGLLAALEEEHLHPIEISGASAGALVAGGYASGMRSQDFLHHMTNLSRADFWDPQIGFGFLKGDRFRMLLRSMLPVKSIEETALPLGITVFDIMARKTRVLREGPLDVAISASCCVPGMFHPVWIQGRPFWDGGLVERSGLSGMQTAGRVFYHHLKSRSKARIPSTLPPRRPQTVTLMQQRLPRVGPFRLFEGQRAFEQSYATMKGLLHKPLSTQFLVTD